MLDNRYENSNGPEGIILLCLPKTPEVEDKTLAEAAAMHNMPPLEIAFDLTTANKEEDTSSFRVMSEPTYCSASRARRAWSSRIPSLFQNGTSRPAQVRGFSPPSG